MRLTVLVLLVIASLCASAQELSAPASQRVTTPARTSFRDLDPSPTIVTARSVSSLLVDLSPGERDNATLQLTVGEEAGGDAQTAARAIEQQWNAGNYDGALTALTALEVTVPSSAIGIGISWKKGVPSVIQGTAGTDVRIGIRDSIVAVAVDRDPVNGNLMAVLHVVKSGMSTWYLNLSTDGGSTWTEKFNWAAAYVVSSVSFTILNGNGYVAFSRGTLQNQLLVYRFSTSNGDQTPWVGGATFITTGTTVAPEKFVEVAATSNNGIAALRNRLYISAITSTHKVRFFWYMVDSTTANEVTTGISSAQQGLSTCYNQPGTYMWLSYVDTLGQVCIDSVYSTSYGRVYRYPNAYHASNTSIGAHKDTIFCAFDMLTSFTQTQYVIRYGSSSIWRFGAFADTSLGSETPAVTLDGDAGIAVVYRYYTDTRAERVARRDYAFGSAWSGSVAISDNEPYITKPAIVYMGSKKYGVLYLSWTNPIKRGAYFDTYEWTATDVESTPALPGRFALEQNYPNPFNPSTTIRYSLPERAQVSVKVFDALGREVAVLVGGEELAGEHEIRFDGSKLSSGVYYYRMQAGSFSATRALLLVK